MSRNITQILTSTLIVFLFSSSALAESCSYSLVKNSMFRFMGTFIGNEKKHNDIFSKQNAMAMECNIKTQDFYVPEQLNSCQLLGPLSVPKNFDIQQGAWQKVGECNYLLRVDINIEGVHKQFDFTMIMNTDKTMLNGRFSDFSGDLYGVVTGVLSK